ncbi:MAG: BaiN/RdsA family NAD(P)/FAD-dependent oxidoreductase [Armatimonadota bacterium]
MTEEAKRVIVVGGGASGLMAAGTAAGRGRQVTVFERNNKVGRKLRIAGKGRCNLTNDTDVDGLLEHIPGNPKFLRTAFYSFGPQDTIAFFKDLGLPTKTERGGRVFPISDNAEDVVHALLKFCRNAGAHFHTDKTVKRVMSSGGRVSGVLTEEDEPILCDAVILSTGGASYPGTGSQGDGYRMAAEFGHTIVPIRPSLVPLETEEAWPAEAQGLSLRNVNLTTLSPQGKKVHSELGEMLFTHFGVSGPLVLSASRHAEPGGKLVIDLKPGLTEELLDARILRDFEKYHRREFGNALVDLLPSSLIPVIIRLSRIGLGTYVHNVTREQRQGLARLLKNLTLTVKALRPFIEAVTTAGGVSVKEIDPRTMESKLIPGLYFTGEVIDVDGYTGGYNLQIAWSTGHLAGESV